MTAKCQGGPFQEPVATGLKELGTSHGHLLGGLGLPGRVLRGSVCSKQDEQTRGLRIFSWMGGFVLVGFPIRKVGSCPISAGSRLSTHAQ